MGARPKHAGAVLCKAPSPGDTPNAPYGTAGAPRGDVDAARGSRSPANTLFAEDERSSLSVSPGVGSLSSNLAKPLSQVFVVQDTWQ